MGPRLAEERACSECFEVRRINRFNHFVYQLLRKDGVDRGVGRNPEERHDRSLLNGFGVRSWLQQGTDWNLLRGGRESEGEKSNMGIILSHSGKRTDKHGSHREMPRTARVAARDQQWHLFKLLPIALLDLRLGLVLTADHDFVVICDADFRVIFCA